MTPPSAPLDLAAYRAKPGSASPGPAWKAARALVLDGRADALELAAEFAEIAEPDTDQLLKLWPQVPGPDGFAESLPAPAFEREGRTELEVRRRDDLTGSITEVYLAYPEDMRDFSALAHMPALRELTLQGVDQLTDLSPFSGLRGLEVLRVACTGHLRTLGDPQDLPALRFLDLHECSALTDLGTVATLPSLQRVRVRECPALPPAVIAGLESRGLLSG